MAVISTLTIQHFKGIKHLELEHCARVNVLLGRNNAGKTTILESLLLLTGSDSQDLLLRIRGVRSHQVPAHEQIHYLFHQTNYDTPITISAGTTDGKRKLTLHSLKYATNEGISGIILEMNWHEAPIRTALILGEDGNFKVHEQSSVDVDPYRSILLTSSFNEKTILHTLEKTLSGENHDSFISELQTFDSRIKDLQIHHGHLYVTYDEVKTPLHISMVGDGLRRYISMSVMMADPTNRIILIDEIDNGLHFSCYVLLWRSLFSLARRYGKQVFVTTHSDESLSALHRALASESRSVQKDLRIYNLMHTKLQGLQAYEYDYTSFSGALDMQLELRS